MVYEVNKLTAVEMPKEFMEKVQENVKAYSAQRQQRELPQNKVLTEPLGFDGNKRIELSPEESNLLQSWSLEEYVSIMNRMRSSDPAAYRAHQKALAEAQDSKEAGADLKVRLSAYRWAYGDVLDKIYDTYPDVNVFVRNPHDLSFTDETRDPRTPYQKKNKMSYLVITNDELKLLQSLNPKDKEEKDLLWEAIKERIVRE